jgi:hypothetical protein
MTSKANGSLRSPLGDDYEKEMAGIEDADTIDVAAYDPKTDEYVLIMIESRPWNQLPEQLLQLREKVNNYVVFALDEGLVTAYPEAANKAICIQLDCVEAPAGESADLLALIERSLKERGIRFVVNLLD